jgi:hypothetical protein
MYDYKDWFQKFFEFYSDFDFTQVISTNEGIAKWRYTYKGRYPKFHLKGILIAGPLNQERNCGISDNRNTEIFAELCKKSSSFLAKNDRFYRAW